MKFRSRFGKGLTFRSRFGGGPVPMNTVVKEWVVTKLYRLFGAEMRGYLDFLAYNSHLLREDWPTEQPHDADSLPF